MHPTAGVPPELVGESPRWKEVLRQVDLVAPTDATVLLRGETGTGKECVARAIQSLSPRRQGPFIAVNCAALPSELVSSELFGHERGAYTGALFAKPGRVELATGGTLFLDEIGDVPPELQVRLLRFLQEGEFERLGGTATLRADARIIAATNRDLDELRAAGLFRDDLYYRLNVFPIRVPPLRERPGDIAPLLRHFLEKYARKVSRRYEHIDNQTFERCAEYPWPGNVRELENLVERAVILCPGPVFSLNPFAFAEPSAAGSAQTSLDAVVRAHLLRALKLCRGKIYGEDGAARLLGLKPSTLQSKLKRLGIDRRRAGGVG